MLPVIALHLLVAGVDVVDLGQVVVILERLFGLRMVFDGVAGKLRGGRLVLFANQLAFGDCVR